MQKYSSNQPKIIALMIILLSMMGIISACSTQNSLQAELSTPIENDATVQVTSESTAPSADPAVLTTVDMVTYEDVPFGFSFKYPSTWQGPDVFPYDGGVRIALGTDVVYPFGTSLEEQIYTIENSYYVTLQYDDQKDPLVDDMYQIMLSLKDGESTETARSLTTRVGSVQIGTFEGVEYTATLSESAQTEAFFAREVVLYDADNHSIRISGFPNNVKIDEGASWRDAYQAVDAANVMNFHVFIDSLRFE